MKKLLLAACSILLSATSFGQRFADLSINMTSPDNTTTIQGTQQFTVAATLTNNGPDPIKTTDTLVLFFLLDNSTTPVNVVVQGQTVPEIPFILSGQMASGVSANFSQSISFAVSPSTGAHSLCAYIGVINRSADSVKDTVVTDNKSCANITITSPTAVSNIETGEVFTTVYPNPARQSANININMSSANDITVYIYDMIGRTVYIKDYGYIQAGENKLQMDLGNIPAGNYIAEIKLGDNYKREKFTIEK